jgi:hypothetical protein
VSIEKIKNLESRLAAFKEDVAEAVYALMRALPDDERLEIMGKFCKHCGGEDPQCQCWNDE